MTTTTTTMAALPASAVMLAPSIGSSGRDFVGTIFHSFHYQLLNINQSIFSNLI